MKVGFRFYFTMASPLSKHRPSSGKVTASLDKLKFCTLHFAFSIYIAYFFQFWQDYWYSFFRGDPVKIWQLLWNYTVIFLGCLLYAISFNWFFKTNHFIMGGFTGMGQTVNRLLPQIPVGTVVFVLNLPLLILGFRKQGAKLLIATLFAITVNSVLIDSVDSWFSFAPMDPLPALLCGGALMGYSLGLLLKKGATTGGTELLARLLRYRFPHLSMGKLCLIIDVAIISLYTLVFREPENAIYGVLAMFITSRVMDLVLYGVISAKLAVIISDRSQEIVQRLTQMDLGATVLMGKGAWSGLEKQVILCVLRQRRIAHIKAAVTALDPGVFFILCDAREVLGQGFSDYFADD